MFAQFERPLLALLPELDAHARRILARTLFSAVHGIAAIGPKKSLSGVVAASGSPHPTRRDFACNHRGSGRASLDQPVQRARGSSRRSLYTGE
jgi:hypothetical protein